LSKTEARPTKVLPWSSALLISSGTDFDLSSLGDGQELLAHGAAVDRLDVHHRMTFVDLLDTVNQAT
jgi:hypothetical protein